MSNTPRYVYHGSQYKLDVIMPQQARGGSEMESKLAIYAAETIDAVIPFALPIRWYPDAPDGKRDFTCEDGKTTLVCGSINPNGVGYVYKLKAESFYKIDNWQWVSEQPCTPVEIIEIKVKDYWHTIQFSDEAKAIQQKLYGYTQ